MQAFNFLEIISEGVHPHGRRDQRHEGPLGRGDLHHQAPRCGGLGSFQIVDFQYSVVEDDMSTDLVVELRLDELPELQLQSSSTVHSGPRFVSCSVN